MAAGSPPSDPGSGRISTGFALGMVYAFAAEGVLVVLMFSSALFGNTRAGVLLAAWGLVLFFAPGLYQWTYVIPVSIHFWRKQQPQTAIGLLIAALFVMCANLLIWVSLGHRHNAR